MRFWHLDIDQTPTAKTDDNHENLYRGRNLVEDLCKYSTAQYLGLVSVEVP